MLTDVYSQDQEDVPRTRSQLLRVDSDAHHNMHLPRLVRDRALVRRHNHTIIRRREGRGPRHADKPRPDSSHALRRSSRQHARCCR